MSKNALIVAAGVISSAILGLAAARALGWLPSGAAKEDGPAVLSCCAVDPQDPAPAPGIALAAARADDEEKKEKGDKEDGASREPAKKEHDAAVGGLPDADPQATGKIAGEIILKGEPKKMPPHAIKADHRDRTFCGHEIVNERLLVNDKKQITNAVASLVRIRNAPKPKPRDIELTNDKCRFLPHVQATAIGSVLKITTKDQGILHSAHAYDLDGKYGFNVAITDTRTVIPQNLRHPGWIIMKCDSHDWMEAHIQVFPHDFYAVTGKDGKFRIEGVPPGEYELLAWHEALEETKQKVKVEAGKTAELKIELAPYEE